MSRTVKQKNKAVAKSCRNHGSCPYCEGNRLYKHRRKLLAYKTNTNNN